MKNTIFAALIALAPLGAGTAARANAPMECSAQQISGTQGHAFLYSCTGEQVVKLPRCGGVIVLRGSSQPASIPRFYLLGQDLQKCNGVVIQGNNQSHAYSLEQKSIAVPNRFFSSHSLKLHFYHTSTNPAGKLAGEIVDVVHIEFKPGASPGERGRFETRVQ